jgi:hypothetical protein
VSPKVLDTPQPVKMMMQSGIVWPEMKEFNQGHYPTDDSTKTARFSNRAPVNDSSLHPFEPPHDIATSKQEGNLLEYQGSMLDMMQSSLTQDWQKRAFSCFRLFFSEKYPGDLS